jgi:uroporphyrin-III C-methyltransferase
MYNKTPKLTVVGAGPGDVDLITLKAIKVLKTADVVLYDALVNEELLEYVANFGIETAMIPGISSSLAVPASQNIPLTKRGSSESFWVITGTTKEHKLSGDIALASKSNATVVILMGMGKLSEIVKLFQQENKNDLPVAIIQDGTTDREKVGIGTVDTILKVVAENDLSNPAIIVLGEVVSHRAVLASVQGQYSEVLIA